MTDSEPKASSEEFERLIQPAFDYLFERGMRDLTLRLVKISVDFDRALQDAQPKSSAERNSG